MVTRYAGAVRISGLLLIVLLASCGKSPDAHPDGGATATASSATTATPTPTPTATATAADADADAATATATNAGKSDFASWMRARVPASAKVEADGAGVKVLHTVADGDTHASLAAAYLDVADIYHAKDFAAALQKKFPALSAGQTIEIPNLLAAAYKDPLEERLLWPEDKILRGIFITGVYAGLYWAQTLDKVAARKMNAIVLDAKDYMGPITYPTKVKLANEMEAAKNPPIPDMARAIRFAHARGIRIILRIPCFHDPLAAKKAPRLSLMGTWGGPMDMGWLDPTNEEALGYVLDLVREGISFGADEIQLDYIRFPIVGPVKSMKLPPAKNGERIRAIRDIVRKVHDVTSASKVPLSLDIFGVTATGDRSDWEALGQDISVLGAECEALSPMVYPSHYDKGYRGWDEPGNHPEIIGIGTKAAVKYLADAKPKPTAVIRSWLQAFAWKTPVYGPKYLVEEARQAETNGGHGWLMWSPGNDYYAAWVGWPVEAKKP